MHATIVQTKWKNFLNICLRENSFKGVFVPSLTPLLITHGCECAAVVPGRSRSGMRAFLLCIFRFPSLLAACWHSAELMSDFCLVTGIC